MKSILTLIFLSGFFISGLGAVDINDESVDILKHSRIYVDRDNNQTIRTITRADAQFTAHQKAFIILGTDHKYPLWITFTLTNPSETTQHRVLSLDDMQIETITLYTEESNGSFSEAYAGTLHREAFRGVRMPHFDIALPPRTTKTFYLKIQSPYFPLYFKVIVSTKDFFLQEDIREHVVWAFTFAILMTILIYNFSLFALTKITIYFYYALHVLGLMTSKKFILGLMFYLLPMEDPWFAVKQAQSIVYFSAFGALTIILFTRHFLQTKQYPRIDSSLNYLLGAILLFTLLHNPDAPEFKLVATLFLFTIVYVMLVGIYALIRKNKYAKYFVFAWSLSLLAIIGAILQSVGAWDGKYLFAYYYETLMLTEVFLFSLAISRNINEINNEKEALSKRLINQKKNETIRLEKVVREKTKDLNDELENNQLLLQELNHRVKNNMQFITSLYALKLQESHDENLKENLRDVERKVLAMGEVHRMLTNSDIAHIKANDYFEKLITTIGESFELDAITFEFDINTDLKVEEAIYCGLIVNELITNAVKYAFNERGGVIRISLGEDETYKYLEVSDNGVGMPDTHESGFGKMMIEALTVQQLNGTIESTTENGTKIKIIFPKSA